MSHSLIEKYPHLKFLLQEDEDETQPSPGPGQSRKSLLGPGGPVTTETEVTVRAAVKTSERKGEPMTMKAEELFARSIGADKDHWLGFQVQQGLSARQQLEQLQIWLGSNKPSSIQRSSGVGWIAVQLGDQDRRVKSAQAKAEWECLEDERTMETVNRLAAKYGDTGGKWLFHVTPQLVDKSWEKIALAMLSGGLGPSVTLVKVSPSGGEENSHVIIIYNKDYQDTNQVMRIENLLRSAGVLGTLLYKPDIFSTLGIYRNNVWGFRPTIYSSTLMKAPGKSRVTVAGTGKSYVNSSKGLELKKDENLNKIVAHISRPKPDFVTDYNENDFRGEEERKEVQEVQEGPGKKKSVKFDLNDNKKKEVEEVEEEESEDEKSKEMESPVTEQLVKNMEILDLKSLDDL